MILALTGSSVDGSLYRDVVDLARRSPGWLDGVVAAWSAYGLTVFAVLMLVGWWRARGVAAAAAMTALAVPVAVLVAFAADSGLKLLVREDRPCRNLPFRTLEACPAPGDYAFPSNHTAIAIAAAVALFFVSRRLGRVASGFAVAMAASRVWVGAHYPHDVIAGALVGGLVAFLAMTVLRRWASGPAGRLAATRLRPLLVA
ncbi:phosphatase PAP2 family protein [Streptomyces sp. NBC_00820]|uniref:phosphatase PAP2 family protein n=1 Tax=Streptomyces sp. NBC_00820 TaxID=2975842 RepID=UPI002ED15A5C|nr:phosphatase PAP2 family protein [Streptomyces sp. NBC_00820]